MNLKDIFLTANTNLLRNKTRTALTVIAIFIGAFTISLTVGITSGISSYIDEQLGNIGAEDVLIIQPKIEFEIDSGPRRYDPENQNTGSAGAGPQMTLFTQSDLDKISSHDDISSASPVFYVSPQFVQFNEGEKYILDVVSYITGTRYSLDAGQLPDNRSDELQLLLPVEYVEPLGFESAQQAVGKEIVFTVANAVLNDERRISATIVGVQSTSLFSGSGANGNKALLDRLNSEITEGLPENYRTQFMGIAAYMVEGLAEERIEQLKSDIDKMGYMAMTVQDQIGVVNDIINTIANVLLFFGAIALLAAVSGIVNTLFMAVQERTKEIGLMKAMGMSKNRVFLLFSVEASLIGFWGATVGIVVAMIVGRIANQIASDTFLKALTGFELTVFPIEYLLLIVGIIMLIAFIAGTLPARKAANQDPIQALRYD